MGQCPSIPGIDSDFFASSLLLSRRTCGVFHLDLYWLHVLSKIVTAIKIENKTVRYQTMHISHIALWTNDLERFKHFYVTYFQAVASPHYSNRARGFESCFLELKSGPRIEAMKVDGLLSKALKPKDRRVGLAHMAISLGSEMNVDQLTQRLKFDGFSILSEPRRTGDGYYESVVLDPDGNQIELTV